MLVHKILFSLKVYIVRNVIQPLDIIIENPIIGEDGTKDEVSCNITDNDQNDCMAQSEEFPHESNECVKERSNIKGENQLNEFQSPSLETAITTESSTVDDLA